MIGPHAYLYHALELEHAQSQLRHAGFEEFTQTVFLHKLHQDGECLFLRHLQHGSLEPNIKFPLIFGTAVLYRCAVFAVYVILIVSRCYEDETPLNETSKK